MDENKKLVIILSICLAVFLLAAFAKTLAADCNEYTINGVFDGPDPYAPVIIDCASPCGIIQADVTRGGRGRVTRRASTARLTRHPAQRRDDQVLRVTVDEHA
jgi:hypothetical protein